LPAFLKTRGLVKVHIDSFNYFVNVEIDKLMQANKIVKPQQDPNFFMEYVKLQNSEKNLCYKQTQKRQSRTALNSFMIKAKPQKFRIDGLGIQECGLESLQLKKI
jgi:DNA-directed RNA polymerase beta subunit